MKLSSFNGRIFESLGKQYLDQCHKVLGFLEANHIKVDLSERDWFRSRNWNKRRTGEKFKQTVSSIGKSNELVEQLVGGGVGVK